MANELKMSRTLMMRAAVVSSLWAPRIRPSGFFSVSVGSPLICGITATPVSKPDMPSASFGNSSRATPTMAKTLPCSLKRRVCQSLIRSG